MNARKFDIMLNGVQPVLIDVTDMGPGYGFVSAAEMREATRTAAQMNYANVFVVMKKFDSLMKRMLTNTLTSDDVVHHTKIKL